ncbi:hypothetical protein FE257_005860 [Aspergillus nanangensis]|uniref:Uncharacterized protein n=1 Tax=Aspergillus nanangensis TaxID=2582783 RepID=A0AAD4GV96_ASPNN|nr:hypothetical protein FE257_005860 [Aspergillus nanangensis]
MTRNGQTAARAAIRWLFRIREVHLMSEDELDQERANLLQKIAHAGGTTSPPDTRFKPKSVG